MNINKINKRINKILDEQISIINGTKQFSSGIFQKKLLEMQLNQTAILPPTFVDHHLLPEMTFSRHCLIKNSIYVPKKVINLYISYTLTALNSTENAEADKYKYNGSGMRFDLCEEFSLPDGSMERNVNAFAKYMRSSAHFDNKSKIS